MSNIRRWGFLLALSAMAVFGQTTPPAVPATPPPGFTAVPFGNSLQIVPTLATVMQNEVTSMESESILSLCGEGMCSTALVVANLNAWASSYCAEQPLAGGCGSTAQVAAIMAPFVAQLQAAFALVPASQWNPSTFTATGTYVNAIGFVQQAAASPAPAAPVVPQLIVDTTSCNFISGINGPSGTICGAMPGVTVAMVQALGPYVSQGGALYSVHISRGLMGTTYFFEPVGN